MIRREESPLPPFRQGGLMVRGKDKLWEGTIKAPLPKGGSARRAVGDSVALLCAPQFDPG